MSAPRELNHPDDFVILTVDVADTPIAELRLSEIYDVETSTMNDNYLLVLKDYVALQLKSTFELCDQFKLLLLDSHFIALHCRANGDIVSCRKPAMERLIRQTLQSRLDTCNPVSVSILTRFKLPGFRFPPRLHESPRFPPKIDGIGILSNFGDSHAILDKTLARAFIPDLNIELMAPHVAFVHSTKYVVGNVILGNVTSNSTACRPCHKHDTIFDGNACDSNVVQGVKPVDIDTGQGGFGTSFMAKCSFAFGIADRIATLEMRTVLPPVQIYSTLYPGNLTECRTASDGETRNLTTPADNGVKATGIKEASGTAMNDIIVSTSDHICDKVMTYHPVTHGWRLLLGTSILAPSSSTAQIVANNPLFNWVILLGISVQVGAARHTDHSFAGQNKHFVSVLPAFLVSAWLPVLLRYQPVDRGRHLLLLGPSTPISVY
jgi:hypothetical protein